MARVTGIGGVWAPFPAGTDYFGSANQWMVNYRVDDETMEDENVESGWCWDSEDNKVDL